MVTGVASFLILSDFLPGVHSLVKGIILITFIASMGKGDGCGENKAFKKMVLCYILINSLIEVNIYSP